jgi:hypothetical protein
MPAETLERVLPREEYDFEPVFVHALEGALRLLLQVLDPAVDTERTGAELCCSSSGSPRGSTLRHSPGGTRR